MLPSFNLSTEKYLFIFLFSPQERTLLRRSFFFLSTYFIIICDSLFTPKRGVRKYKTYLATLCMQLPMYVHTYSRV